MRVTSVERQFHNTGGLHDLTDTDAARLHHGRIGLDFDLLGNLSDLENDIDCRIGAHLQDDSCLYKAAKTRQARFQLVGTQWKIRQSVGPGFVGNGHPGDTGLGLRCGDFHAGQHRTALILVSSAHLCCSLGPQAAAHHRYKHG